MSREKKPEGEKFKTLTFSLHPALLQAVKDKAKSECVNLSTMLSIYLELWVNGSIIEDSISKVNDNYQLVSNIAGTSAPTPDPRVDDIVQQLKDVSNRVVVLEVASKMDGDYIDLLEDRILNLEYNYIERKQEKQPEEQEEEDNFDDPAQDTVMDASSLPEVPTSEELPAQEKVREERITLTDEMRNILAEKIKSTGIKYPDLAKITGVNESALKKIRNGYQVKSLAMNEYSALMSLENTYVLTISFLRKAPNRCYPVYLFIFVGTLFCIMPDTHDSIVVL